MAVTENIDLKALFCIEYGLYAITSREGTKDNVMIVNTVIQVTNTPNRIAVTINKESFSHGMIQRTGKMNVNCLTVDATYHLFQQFGMQSGRDADKLSGVEFFRSENQLAVLSAHVNAFLSLQVEQYVDLGTHGIFICSITEARVLSDREGMTYRYYRENVKPKNQIKEKKGFVCKICGYVYEGDSLPDGFVCPLCKHGREDFEKITES